MQTSGAIHQCLYDSSASLPHLLCIWVHLRGQLKRIVLTGSPSLTALVTVPLHPEGVGAAPAITASFILVCEVTLVLALILKYSKSIVSVLNDQLKSFSLLLDGPHTI